MNPPQAAGGPHQGVRLLLVHLNPWTVVGKRALATGLNATIVPGVVFGLVWAGSVLVAWRSRMRTIVMLDVTLALATRSALAVDGQDLRVPCTSTSRFGRGAPAG